MFCLVKFLAWFMLDGMSLAVFLERRRIRWMALPTEMISAMGSGFISTREFCV